jgi:hypothetical protein
MNPADLDAAALPWKELVRLCLAKLTPTQRPAVAKQFAAACKAHGWDVWAGLKIEGEPGPAMAELTAANEALASENARQDVEIGRLRASETALKAQVALLVRGLVLAEDRWRRLPRYRKRLAWMRGYQRQWVERRKIAA